MALTLPLTQRAPGLSCGQAFLRRMDSRAVVAMIVVDTKPVILPNLHNDHMTNLKRQLRKVWQLRPYLN